jgi:lysophospholipase
VSKTIEQLEPRFREPEGWRWHTITRITESGDTRKIRVGSVFPNAADHDGRPPKAMLVCLPGLSEFGEKYFETAQWALSKNLGFCVIDWVGQGLSSRYLGNPHKRHSAGFDEDLEDLDLWLQQYILRSAVITDEGRLPLIMLGHSMGGNLGLRYLQQHPDIFRYAAFTAPMLGIYGLYLPDFVTRFLTCALAKWKGENYVLGGKDWTLHPDVTDSSATLTSDPNRGSLHNVYSEAMEAARIGNVTYKWLNEAIKSCLIARKRKALESITIPTLFAVAEHEKLVINSHIKRTAKITPNARCIVMQGSKHEILMEKDAIRDKFLNEFYTDIQEHIISSSESLKRF